MKSLGLGLILLGLLASAASAEEQKPVISCAGNQRNLRTYLKIHEVLFTQRDSSRVAEFYAPQVISHNQDSGGGDVQTVTPANMAAMWEASKRNNPERRLVDDLILCSGDYVIVRTRVHSTDNTGIGGNPPTHKPYVVSAIDIYRFANGKVVERWGNSDVMGLALRLGFKLVPADAANANKGAQP